MAETSARCPHCQTCYPIDEADLDRPCRCPSCGLSLVPDRAEDSLALLLDPAPPPAPATAHDATAGGGPGASTAVGPLIWKVGDVVLGLYEVKQVHAGGMGFVYRVRHRGWGLDLAVKSPRPDCFRNERDKDNFEREAETWVRLGLHPHTVKRDYVRRIDDVPRLFAEYVSGGSVADWIRSRRLYTGTPEQKLARILDVAVQLAWGLHHAHEQGFVHQDVKPANLLLAPARSRSSLAGHRPEAGDSWVAKVTDFGLARARAGTGEATGRKSRRSLLVSTGGLTPAYCSPEQVRREPLSRQTDVWSWAVSILEMFAGAVTWSGGELAAEALEQYLGGSAIQPLLPSMPPTLADLLRRCLERQPLMRPGSMLDVAAELQEIYGQALAAPYPRPLPRAAEALAANLNNRAVSLLDLGKPEEAEPLWEEALRIEAHHPESVYNRGLLQWRTGRLSAEALVQQLREVCASHPGDWRPKYLLAEIHLARQDGEAAQATLQEIRSEDAQDEDAQASVEGARQQLASLIRPSRLLEGPVKPVTSVCLSPDGRRALAGSADRTLRLWDTATARLLRTFEGHRGTVTRVALLADGRLALSAAADRTVKLWDVETGRCLRTFEGHSAAVLALSVSGDGLLLLTGSEDGSFLLWETETGRCLGAFRNDAEQVEGATLCPDGASVLSISAALPSAGAREQEFHLWDLASGRLLRAFPGHRQRVTALCLSADGSQVLSAGRDNTLKLWDVAGGDCLRLFNGHTEPVTAVALSGDGRQAFSGTEQGNVKVWDVTTGKCLRSCEGHHFAITSVALDAAGELGLSGSCGKEVKLWPNLRGPPAAPSVVCRVEDVDRTMDAGEVYARALNLARQALAVGEVSAAAQRLRQARAQPGYSRHAQALDAWMELYVWLPRTTLSAGWEGGTFAGHRHAVTCVSLSLDGSQALSGSKDRTLRLWEVPSGRCVQTLRGHEGTVWSVFLSADGRHALSGSADRTVKLWCTSSGRCLRTFRGHRGAVWSVCLTADGKYAVSAGWDRTIKLWETAGGRCLRTLEAHEREINRVALSPDERLLASAGWEGTVAVWEMASGRCRTRLRGHQGPVWALCWGQEGVQVLSGGEDKTLRLWDVSGDRCLRVLRGHTWQVPAACLSRDGRHALSGSWDRTIKLWDTATGQCVRTFEGHEDKVTAVGLTADGRYALSGSEDATLRLWVLDWEVEDTALADWDDRARPFLETFLTLHTPHAAALPRYWVTERDLGRALTRAGAPSWDQTNLHTLMYMLGCAGFGWLRPKGVQRQLTELAGR